MRGVIVYFQSISLISGPPYTVYLPRISCLQFSQLFQISALAFWQGTQFSSFCDLLCQLSLIHLLYITQNFVINFHVLSSPLCTLWSLQAETSFQRVCDEIREKQSCLILHKFTGILPWTLNPNLWRIVKYYNKTVLGEISERKASRINVIQN